MPRGAHVRPTPDRVREALFNRLGQDLTGFHVLDAYAGSGALGFEAVSRGAARVVFIEADASVAAGLRRTAVALGVDDRVAVVRGHAETSLGRANSLGGPFDLVLADPPFAAPRDAFLAGVAASGFLREGGTVVIERETKADAPACPRGLCVFQQARYGRVSLDFFERASP